MFEHPDAHDFVERLIRFKVPVVTHLNAAPLVYLRLSNPLPRQLGLGYAQRDANRLRAIASGRMNQESSPAAPDVQEAVAGTKAQFLANVVELVTLGGVQVHVRSFAEVGGRILQALVQPERKEIGWEIIVITDSLAIPILGMKLSLQARLLTPWASHSFCRQLAQDVRKNQILAKSPIAVFKQILGQVKGGFDIAFNIEIVTQIRLCKSQFVGREKHLAQGARMFENQRKTWLRACSPGASVPKANLKITFWVAGE